MIKHQLFALDHLLDDHYALWDFGDGLPEFRHDAEGTTIADRVELVRLGFVMITFGLWQKMEPPQSTPNVRQGQYWTQHHGGLRMERLAMFSNLRILDIRSSGNLVSAAQKTNSEPSVNFRNWGGKLSSNLLNLGSCI